jgi:hypothetical protein
MARLPKIIVKLPSGDTKEYVCDLEQAGEYLDFKQGGFLVEGQGIQSYEELVNLASQDKFKNKEYLVIEWLHVIGGG